MAKRPRWISPDADRCRRWRSRPCGWRYRPGGWTRTAGSPGTRRSTVRWSWPCPISTRRGSSRACPARSARRSARRAASSMVPHADRWRPARSAAACAACPCAETPAPASTVTAAARAAWIFAWATRGWRVKAPGANASRPRWISHRCSSPTGWTPPKANCAAASRCVASATRQKFPPASTGATLLWANRPPPASPCAPPSRDARPRAPSALKRATSGWADRRSTCSRCRLKAIARGTTQRLRSTACPGALALRWTVDFRRRAICGEERFRRWRWSRAATRPGTCANRQPSRLRRHRVSSRSNPRVSMPRRRPCACAPAAAPASPRATWRWPSSICASSHPGWAEAKAPGSRWRANSTPTHSSRAVLRANCARSSMQASRHSWSRPSSTRVRRLSNSPISAWRQCSTQSRRRQAWWRRRAVTAICAQTHGWPRLLPPMASCRARWTCGCPISLPWRDSAIRSPPHRVGSKAISRSRAPAPRRSSTAGSTSRASARSSRPLASPCTRARCAPDPERAAAWSWKGRWAWAKACWRWPVKSR